MSEDEAFKEMLEAAVAFTDWAAGEGITPPKPMFWPDVTICNYVNAIGFDGDGELFAAHVRDRLAKVFNRPVAQPNVWQPIDNAPKDGTWILAFVVPDGKIPAIVKWEDDDWLFDAVAEMFSDDVTFKIKPTHWMPLPAPPEAT